MANIVFLHYVRDGKTYDLTLQKTDSKSFEKAVKINNEMYKVGGNREEVDFLTSRIQEFSSHQNISGDALKDRLIELGAQQNTIDCPLIKTALKTKSLQSLHFPSSNTSKIEKTQELLDSHYEEGLPGCNLVIMKEGQMVYSCSQGLADYEQKTKMNIDTRQHFGSVSKQFTAMSILLLAEEGKLNLDEDIRTYIPKFPVCFFNGEEVTLTIRHVLEMRSGLPEVLTYAFLAGKKDQDLTAEQKMDPLFKQETIELAFAPGTDMHYCNTNYYLLPEIVYRLSKQTIKEYADSNIFKKLGMNSTSFIDPNQPVFEQSIKGYDVVPNEKVQECTTHNETWGPCGVIGTPRDMVLWDANFTNNRLGKKLPQLIETFTALPKPPLKKGGLEYGNGLFVGLLGKYKIERHAGAIEGFTTEFLRITHTERPQEHLSFFIASNRNDDQQHTVNSIAMKLAQIWMEEQIFPSEMGAPPPMQEEPKSLTTKSELTSYQGKYDCSILGASYECVIGEREGNVGLILKKLKDPHVEDKDHEIFFLEKHPKDKDAFFSRQESSAEFHFQPGKGFTFTDRSQGIINLRFLKQP